MALARFEYLHTEAAGPAPAPTGPEPADSLLTGHPARTAPRRQIVYAEGDEPTRMYYVQTGRVKTTKTTSAGKELITGFYQAGEFFDYKALLEASPYYEAAVAVEDSTLLYVPADEFRQGLRSPEVSQQLVRLMASRKREQ